MPVPRELFKRDLLVRRIELVRELSRKGKHPNEIKEALDSLKKEFLSENGRYARKELFYLNLEGKRYAERLDELDFFLEEQRRWKRLYRELLYDVRQNPRRAYQRWQDLLKRASLLYKDMLKRLVRADVLYWDPQSELYHFAAEPKSKNPRRRKINAEEYVRNVAGRGINILKSEYLPVFIRLYDEHFVISEVLRKVASDEKYYGKCISSLAGSYLKKIKSFKENELPWAEFFYLLETLKAIRADPSLVLKNR